MTAVVELAPGTARDGEATRWTLCALVVIAAHLLVGIGLLLRSIVAIPVALPPPAIMIDLVSPEPTPAVLAPAVPEIIEPPLVPEILPELAPAAQPDVILPPPPKPRERPPVPHRPEPVKLPEPVAQPQTAPATPTATAPEAKTPEPAPPSVAAAAVSEDALAKFLRTVSIHLERLKHYPRDAAIRHEQGVVLLRFLLARDGKVLGAELERSSGHDLLDKEVLALIRRAEPLPPFPAELTQQQLQLVLPVPFSLR